MVVYSCTFLSRSSGAILSNASKLLKKYAEHPSLFSISTNADEQQISELFRGLTSRPNTSAIGCLSAPLPQGGRPQISCSLAFFCPDRSHVFTSNIPGKPAPQVGRWNINRRQEGNRAPSLDFAGDAFQNRWSTNEAPPALPPSLQGLRPDEVTDVVYISDLFPEGLMSALGRFQNANELGLIATSTPFITGRPVTLFHHQNGSTDILGKGAVGIALAGRTSKPVATRQTSYTGLESLSEPMELTSCEGNMVNTLNNQNPAQLLLDAIQARGLTATLGSDIKQDKFLLGTMNNGTVDQLFEITAGDPSRGNISLNTDNRLSLNATVQFFYRSSSTPMTATPLSTPDHCSVDFITSPEAETDRLSHDSDDEVTTIERRLLTASENGFIARNSEKTAWRCTVPGSSSSLTWPLVS